MSDHRIVRREYQMRETKWATESSITYVCSCGYKASSKTGAMEHVTGLDAPLGEATHE